MNILAIETSCDETAAAVVRAGREVLSNLVLSQVDMHKIFGGVVPEIASRKHLDALAQLVAAAIRDAGLKKEQLDAVAVTYAPGLIGALLCGVGFAKGLAYGLQKPLIPVHHLRGHIAANYLTHPQLAPPFISLIVSGGHTMVVKVEDYTSMQCLATTRDDAAGEAFDKVARVLGLGYPGGPVLDRLAREGDKTVYPLPTPRVEGAPLDFSFSGLKTAVINRVHNADQKGEPLCTAHLAASFTDKVCDVLLTSAFAACQKEQIPVLCLAGGVACNSHLRAAAAARAAAQGVTLYLPEPALCQDNAAMIAAQAFHELAAGRTAENTLNAYATRDISLG